MRHLKTYEDINYYQYTLGEVEYKLLNNVNDENLLYLIKLYIIYKEGYKNTTPEDIIITKFNKKDRIIIIYSTTNQVEKLLVITNEEEFINFINNPELSIATNKYNL